MRVAPLLLLAPCACGPAPLADLGAPPTSPPAAAPKACFTTDPATITFRSALSRDVAIRGPAGCIVAEIVVTGAGFRLRDPFAPVTLEGPEGPRWIAVEVDLDVPHEGQLTLTDGDGVAWVVPLSSVAAVRGCLPPNRIVDFGPSPGEPVRRRERVDNACDTPVHLDEGVIEGGTSAFSLANTLPLTIPPRGSVELDMTFEPVADFDTGQLVIFGNDRDREPLLWPLIGHR